MKCPINLGGLRVLLAATATVLFSQVSQAAPIAIPLVPGGTVTPTQNIVPVGGALVGSTTQGFSSNDLPLHPNGTKFTGTLITNVYAGDPTNPLAGLTFTFQLINNGPSTLERLSTTDFTGALTDVGYDAITVPGTIPTTVDRDATGGIIGWNFIQAPGLGRVGAPGTSALLIVDTNAAAFQQSLDSVIDSSSATVLSYGPLVPEPATISLLAITGGMLAMRRRA